MTLGVCVTITECIYITLTCMYFSETLFEITILAGKMQIKKKSEESECSFLSWENMFINFIVFHCPIYI